VMATLGLLYERLLVAGFEALSPVAPTLLIGAGPDGEQFFEAPAGWLSRQELTWETLPERTSELLAAGPVLLVPPWDRVPELGGGRKTRPTPLYRQILCDLRPAGPGSVMGLLVPAQAWVSEANWAADLRAAVAERWDTHLIVYGLGAMGGLHSDFTAAAVLLRACAAERPPLKVFRFSGRDEAAATEKDLRALLTRRGGRTRNGYVACQLPEPVESLAFELHDPAVADRRADLASFGGVQELEELFDRLPTVHPADSARVLLPVEKPGAVRLIGGRDISRDGTITPPSDDTLWGQIPDRCLLAVGDILLRAIQRSTDPGGFVLAEVTAQDLPAAASNTTIALRPRSGLDPQQLRFALMFLRTPAARTLMPTTDAGVRVLGSQLSRLPIPQPDETLATALDDMAAARSRLEAWQAEADELLSSVFLEKSASVARSKIIASGQVLRLRVEAASLLDDLGHIVRTRFPYPIASRWREAEAMTSTPTAQDAFAAVLDATEVLLCYTAQLALALAWNAGIELGSAAAIRTKLASGRTGPGFGDWAFVLEEVSAPRKLRDLPPPHPLHDIATLLGTKNAAQARQRLSDYRNDQSHQRRIHPVDLPQATTAALADLVLLLKAARFLADWPLLYITDVHWDTLTRTATVDYREMTGDHPVVPTRTMTVSRNDLETDSLYLRDSGHELHLLRPFLTGRDCPSCYLWSTFHVDRAPKDKIILKSLEHGHILTDDTPDLRASLQHVHLL